VHEVRGVSTAPGRISAGETARRGDAAIPYLQLGFWSFRHGRISRDAGRERPRCPAPQPAQPHWAHSAKKPRKLQPELHSFGHARTTRGGAPSQWYARNLMETVSSANIQSLSWLTTFLSPANYRLSLHSLYTVQLQCAPISALFRSDSGMYAVQLGCTRFVRRICSTTAMYDRSVIQTAYTRVVTPISRTTGADPGL